MHIQKINKWKAIGVLSVLSMFLHDCNYKIHQPVEIPLEGKVMRVYVPFKPELGWTKITPTSTVRFSDGGKEYVYTINGATVESPMPPNGFNPLDATIPELEQYGFPLPPGKSQQVTYEKWVKFVSSMDIVDNATQYQTQDHNIALCGIFCSENFYNHSGYLVTDKPGVMTEDSISGVQQISRPSGTYISNITAEYTQVKAHTTPCSNPAESTWISFGGYGGISSDLSTSNPLTQIGSMVRPGGRIVPFYEYISNDGTDSGARTIPIRDNPGDKMSVYMAYMPKVNKIAFIISNQSVTYKNGGHPTVVRLLKDAVNVTDPGKNYFYPYGASVSIEAPVINNYPFYWGRRPMVDFGTENITKAYVGFRIDNKVKWKGLGDIGNLGSANLFEGRSTVTGATQVTISAIQGTNQNSFTGKWLHC